MKIFQSMEICRFTWNYAWLRQPFRKYINSIFFTLGDEKS